MSDHLIGAECLVPSAPSPKRIRPNRSIPPRPTRADGSLLDLDEMPAGAPLTSFEVAGLFRCTPGTIDRICGDDPNDPHRPPHPVTVRGKRLFTVANVRQVLANGIPRKAFKKHRKSAKK